MGWGPIIPNVDFGDFTPPALGVSGDLTGEGDNPKLLLIGVTPCCTVLVSWKLVDFSLVLVNFEVNCHDNASQFFSVSIFYDCI